MLIAFTLIKTLGKTILPSFLLPSPPRSHHLVSQQQDCLEAELPRAEVEQILQTGSQQLHHHHVVVALSPAPLYCWNTHWRIEGSRKQGKGLQLGTYLFHCVFLHFGKLFFLCVC